MTCARQRSSQECRFLALFFVLLLFLRFGCPCFFLESPNLVHFFKKKKKKFCSVLNARLSEVMESKILGEAQGGFRRNRRTTDQVFVVSGIGQIRRSQGKKTWMAFLDFKKAFPSVWREGLWEKMKEYGIDGKFLRVCQNLYCDVGARVRVGKVFSERYTIEEGLRQGCILSPSLFSLFLMDLADELERRGLG